MTNKQNYRLLMDSKRAAALPPAVIVPDGTDVSALCEELDDVIQERHVVVERAQWLWGPGYLLMAKDDLKALDDQAAALRRKIALLIEGGAR